MSDSTVQRRTDAPSTLAELRSVEAERRRLLDEAEGLRRQAAALAAEADALIATMLLAALGLDEETA